MARVRKPLVLAGDVGGTKTDLALVDRVGKRLVPVVQHRLESRSYRRFEDMLKAFLGSEPVDISAACFGVAGPVVGGRCRATNLPWVIETRALQRMLGIDRVGLLNDLEAMAYGVQTLAPDSLVTLNSGRPQPRAAIAVIAAGTGLGEAALIWDGLHYRAMASEGGHADFAPRTELEVQLWRHLRRRYGHVSYERVVSGPGKLAVYDFLRHVMKAKEPAWLKARMARADHSAVVSEVALEGRWRPCVKAVELFASVYGAEAGNLALKVMATGGVFVGGGIAPTILPVLKRGPFMDAFVDKGRLSGMMARIPVHVILEPKTALLGAANYAWRLSARR